MLTKSWAGGRFRFHQDAETVYCAEVVALTYQAMGLLPDHRPRNWYDPGKFWSGDGLELQQGGDTGPGDCGGARTRSRGMTSCGS